MLERIGQAPIILDGTLTINTDGLGRADQLEWKASGIEDFETFIEMRNTGRTEVDVLHSRLRRERFTKPTILRVALQNWDGNTDGRPGDNYDEHYPIPAPAGEGESGSQNDFPGRPGDCEFHPDGYEGPSPNSFIHGGKVGNTGVQGGPGGPALSANTLNFDLNCQSQVRDYYLTASGGQGGKGGTGGPGGMGGTGGRGSVGGPGSDCTCSQQDAVNQVGNGGPGGQGGPGGPAGPGGTGGTGGLPGDAGLVIVTYPPSIARQRFHIFQNGGLPGPPGDPGMPGERGFGGPGGPGGLKKATSVNCTVMTGLPLNGADGPEGVRGPSGSPGNPGQYGNNGMTGQGKMPRWRQLSCPNAVFIDPPCLFPPPPGRLAPLICISPILVDILGNGFNLTDAAGGVYFDLDSNGGLESIGWTSQASDDAFLCLDRNGDGKISTGRELFGNMTRQPELTDSADYNGYLALNLFDGASYGGNGDGVITSADTVYSLLRLWVDANHNGVSEAGELTTLSARGVTAISLTFAETEVEDPLGNEFRFVSSAQVAGNTRITTDVFFVVAP